jgi:hypothetical protein
MRGQLQALVVFFILIRALVACPLGTLIDIIQELSRSLVRYSPESILV